MMKIALLAAACLALAAESRAGGDIVYSARYYKPGWKTASHYHLWRINPDGSGRTAVTHGDADDLAPAWLADGQTILFVREEGDTQRLCRINASGGEVTTLATIPRSGCGQGFLSPDRRSYVMRDNENSWSFSRLDLQTGQIQKLGKGTDLAWSGDSRRLYLRDNSPAGSRSFALDLAEWTVHPLGQDLGAAVWLDNQTLVAELAGQETKRDVVTMDCFGRRLAQISLQLDPEGGSGDFADALYTIPGTRDAIIYGRHAGGSSQGPAQTFYRLDLKTGAHAFLANGRDIAWSPDGRSFCTSDGWDLAPFNGNHGEWVSPLSIVTLADGHQRKIVEGMVCVDGFDWRRP